MSNFKLSNLFTALHRFNSVPINTDIEKEDLNEIYAKMFDEISPEIEFNEELCTHVVQSEIPLNQIPSTYNGHWKYICLSFRFLSLLDDALQKGHNLSVQNIKVLGLCFKGLSTIGIACNIRPTLPHYVNIPSLKPKQTTEGILSQYNLLKLTTLRLLQYADHKVFRPLVIQNCLSHIMVALFQLAKCPLSKPQDKVHKSGFFMTQELYKLFMEDHLRFTQSLHNLQKHTYGPIFIKEIIILFRAPHAPAWFIKEVNTLLTNSILTQKTGLQDVINVILDGCGDDSANFWKGIQVLSKIIVQLLQSPKNQPIICEQLFAYMVDCFPEDGKSYRLPDRLFTECTKLLYHENRELCEQKFLPRLYENLNKFAKPEYDIDESGDMTTAIAREVRLVHGCFVASSPSDILTKLPLLRIRPYILIFFRLYQEMMIPLATESVVSDLKEILRELLINSGDNINLMFDAILFNIIDKSILPFRDDIHFQFPPNNQMTVSKSCQKMKYTLRSSAIILNQLIEDDKKLITKLFTFYMSCVTNKSKYFPRLSNIDLLCSEEELVNANDSALYIHQEVARMSDTTVIRRHLASKSCGILDFAKPMLALAIESQVHKSTDFEQSSFQNIFVIIMILHSLKQSATRWKPDPELNKILHTIHSETINDELKSLISTLITPERVESVNKTEEKSEYNRALEDVCDVMLPVKGHGLMVLAKLVENKDENAMQNKNYLLTIFQQNLKNGDSYIYLSAVRGLAALGNVFTDTVLEVLCEEYAYFAREFEQDNSLETRMKLGEVLVKITKELGDMAPKYKALLLNTFLGAAKDDDNLIRASSLSNLGEICRVLGYKLGTILVEVLACTTAVIACDRAPEPRRAAVTVIRQLFHGVGSEVIAYFKEDILPVYRLLKRLYRDDKDDVVRLQAQLALEELNVNMENLVFPMLDMHPDKSIIHLNR